MFPEGMKTEEFGKWCKQKNTALENDLISDLAD
jgi:hypothetical protein